MKLCIAAIVKDEVEYVLEWIAFHRAIGVSGFLIADNGSSDGTKEILKELQRHEVVQVIDFPTSGGVAPQIPAYQQLVALAAKQYDLAAFIDADEFIVPMAEDATLLPLLERIFKDNTVGALALNWAVFGSAGAIFREDLPVTERFTLRARKEFGVNLHYKSIVRPDRVVRFYNPHAAQLSSGRLVDTEGNDVVIHERHGVGLSAQVNWSHARINHYAVKSAEEFILKKSRRGSAANLDKVKHRRYFLTHDKNEEECIVAKEMGSRLQEEMAHLRKLIAPVVRRRDNDPRHLIELKPLGAVRATSKPNVYRSRRPAPTLALSTDLHELSGKWVLFSGSVLKDDCESQAQLLISTSGHGEVKVPVAVPSDGRVCDLFRMPRDAQALRFMPQQSPGRMELRDFSLEPVGLLRRHKHRCERIRSVLQACPPEQMRTAGLTAMWRMAPTHRVYKLAQTLWNFSPGEQARANQQRPAEPAVEAEKVAAQQTP